MVWWRGGWWASKKASKATVHHIGIHWTLKMSKYVKTVVVHLIHKLCYVTMIFFNNWFFKTRVRFVAVDVLKSRMELILSTVFFQQSKIWCENIQLNLWTVRAPTIYLRFDWLTANNFESRRWLVEKSCDFARRKFELKMKPNRRLRRDRPFKNVR